MSKHTPGPWKAEVNEKSASIAILGRHGDAGRIRASDGYGYMLHIDCSEAASDGAMFAPMLPEQVANARLIGAAPEILEALKACSAVLRSFAAMTPVNGWARDQIDAAMGPADRAIAKAEGRS